MSESATYSGQTVFFSDARDMSAIQDESVDFIITSPPYWDLKDYGDSALEIGDSSYEQYIRDLEHVWSQCFRKAKPGAAMVINVNSRRLTCH